MGGKPLRRESSARVARTQILVYIYIYIYIYIWGPISRVQGSNAGSPQMVAGAKNDFSRCSSCMGRLVSSRSLSKKELEDTLESFSVLFGAAMDLQKL